MLNRRQCTPVVSQTSIVETVVLLTRKIFTVPLTRPVCRGNRDISPPDSRPCPGPVSEVSPLFRPRQGRFCQLAQGCQEEMS